jgi:putative oxidoreductase
MFKDQDHIAVVGRCLIAAPFLFSGVGKIMAPAATQAYIASVGLPMPPIGYAIAIAIEVGGGLLLLLGLQTRLIATVIAAFTIVTAFVFHRDFANQAQLVNFLKNLVMAGGLLQVAAFGGGKLSLDALRGRERRGSTNLGARRTAD